MPPRHKPSADRPQAPSRWTFLFLPIRMRQSSDGVRNIFTKSLHLQEVISGTIDLTQLNHGYSTSCMVDSRVSSSTVLQSTMVFVFGSVLHGSQQLSTLLAHVLVNANMTTIHTTISISVIELLNLIKKPIAQMSIFSKSREIRSKINLECLF